MIHFVTALRCEAAPLIDHFKMKAAGNHGQVSLYQSDSACLVISGLGSIQSAIATTYLQAKTPSGAWLNIGIAGHQTADIGELLLAHKISTPLLKQNFYPQFLRKNLIAESPLVSVDQPSFDYPENAAFDMEGFGFYKAALHFSSLEKTHCLKIVSDNRDNPPRKFDKAWISQLIQRHLPAIENFAQSIAAIETPSPPCSQDYLDTFHFTKTQELQLAKRLQQLDALKTQATTNLQAFANAKDLLAHLQEQVDQNAFQRIG